VSTPGPAAVVVHIPHASLVVPSDVAAGLLLTPAELEHELLVMTDRYTDELFAVPSSLRDTAVGAFEELGWRVAVDRPFAGALVPMRFYQKDVRVRAVMIEVRRDLYMDERSGARLPRFDEVRERISGALRTLTAVGTSRGGGA